VEPTRSIDIRYPVGEGSYLAASASALCAIHCVAAPVLVLVSPALRISQTAEHAMIAVATAIAFVFLAWGVKRHGRVAVWFPALLGLSIWIGGEWIVDHSHRGLLLHALGSTFLAGGLIWNGWLTHAARCVDCCCPSHPEHSGVGQGN